MSEDDALYPHYAHLKIKPWDYIEANNLTFTEGCIIKYISRYRQKGQDGMTDLLKARACLNGLIERYEELEANGETSR